LFTQSTFWLPGLINNTAKNLVNIIWASSESTSTIGIFATLTFEAISMGTAFVELDESEIDIVRNGQRFPFTLENSASFEII
jgi:hypothetical protein